MPAGSATGIAPTCPQPGTGQPHSSDSKNNGRGEKKPPRNKDNENNAVFQRVLLEIVSPAGKRNQFPHKLKRLRLSKTSPHQLPPPTPARLGQGWRRARGGTRRAPAQAVSSPRLRSLPRLMLDPPSVSPSAWGSISAGTHGCAAETAENAETAAETAPRRAPPTTNLPARSVPVPGRKRGL